MWMLDSVRKACTIRIRSKQTFDIKKKNTSKVFFFFTLPALSKKESADVINRIKLVWILPVHYCPCTGIQGQTDIQTKRDAMKDEGIQSKQMFEALNISIWKLTYAVFNILFIHNCINSSMWESVKNINLISLLDMNFCQLECICIKKWMVNVQPQTKERQFRE